jgi:hypothetical protein
VSAQGVLGLFTVEHNDLTAGPLYRLASEERQKEISAWHVWFFWWVLVVLIAVHALANVWYGLARKEPLITAMVTGRKPAAGYLDGYEAQLVARPLRRAFVCLVLAAALVFGSIYGALGGRWL